MATTEVYFLEKETSDKVSVYALFEEDGKSGQQYDFGCNSKEMFERVKKTLRENRLTLYADGIFTKGVSSCFMVLNESQERKYRNGEMVEGVLGTNYASSLFNLVLNGSNDSNSYKFNVDPEVRTFELKFKPNHIKTMKNFKTDVSQLIPLKQEKVWSYFSQKNFVMKALDYITGDKKAKFDDFILSLLQKDSYDATRSWLQEQIQAAFEATEGEISQELRDRDSIAVDKANQVQLEFEKQKQELLKKISDYDAVRTVNETLTAELEYVQSELDLAKKDVETGKKLYERATKEIAELKADIKQKETTHNELVKELVSAVSRKGSDKSTTINKV